MENSVFKTSVTFIRSSIIDKMQRKTALISLINSNLSPYSDESVRLDLLSSLGLFGHINAIYLNLKVNGKERTMKIDCTLLKVISTNEKINTENKADRGSHSFLVAFHQREKRTRRINADHIYIEEEEKNQALHEKDFGKIRWKESHYFLFISTWSKSSLK